MAKKNGRNTKGRIVAAAWKLFYEQGYENTTVEDIVYESETSKGSFYHYFEGKDALMGSLSVLFDEKYEELRGRIDPRMDTVEDADLAESGAVQHDRHERAAGAAVAASLVPARHPRRKAPARPRADVLQAPDAGGAHGQERGELSRAVTANEIVKAYAMFERALMYDWCLCEGEYALSGYAARMMPVFLEGFRTKNANLS